MPRTGPNAANTSTKVAFDVDGNPWLVVGTPDGYEAQRLVITERHLFDRSWQAVRFVAEYSTPSFEGLVGGPYVCAASYPDELRPYLCTLKPGHEGDHHAQGPDDELIARWSD